jgi:phosphoribosylamine--glycine ligase
VVLRGCKRQGGLAVAQGEERGFLALKEFLDHDFGAGRAKRAVEHHVDRGFRFGDPEAQVLLPRFTSDPAQLLLEAARGELRSTPTFDDGAAITIALCSEGYPLSTRTGDPIEGIVDAEAVDGVTVYRAGVGAGDTTAGGRVLNVTALAPTIAEARSRAYDAVARISWPGMHHRTDIASQAF